MKKNSILGILLLLSTFSATKAGNTQDLPDLWIERLLNARQEIQHQMQKQGMPVETAWIKAGESATPLSVQITGEERLVLITDGGEDGTGNDHAVWGNARLITTDDKIIWLDELNPEFSVAGWQVPLMNQNFSGGTLRIGEKKYEHGILCHANGMLVYNLDKKFKRFETEVGIERNSGSGSVYFRIVNFFPREVAAKLIQLHPEEIGAFTSVIPFDIWLSEEKESTTWEKKAVETYLDQLHDPTFFKNRLTSIEKETDPRTKQHLLLQLFGIQARIFNLQTELEWLNPTAIRMAFEDMKKVPTFDAATYAPLLTELETLYAKGFNRIYQGDETAIQEAKKALNLKKKILLANPLLDNNKIIATRFNLGSEARSAMAPAMGTQQDNWSNQMSANREGFDAAIVELSGYRSEIKEQIIHKPRGAESITDLKLHWDGERILFTSLMPDKRWNIFEIKTDGSSLRPLVQTTEPDLEFFDGTWLPDGRVLANSNIGYQGVPCVHGGDLVGNMVLYDPVTKNLRRLTFDQDANWNPVVMNNGRIMYTRWEYTDLTHYFSRIVMHMNPDGTENKGLFGSGSLFPNSIFDEQPLPEDASAFIGVISGHHGVARSGRLILFDPAKSRKGTAGMIQELPFRNREIIPLIKDELVDGVWPQFIKPTPLNNNYFLVTAKLHPNALWGIYLVDIFDNLTPILSTEGTGYISPIAVRKTKTPPIIPDRINPEEKEATVFIQDIYEGEGLSGVPRGTIKSIRVLAYEYAYGKSPSDHIAQGIQSGWDIKRLLGTVPVEEDGSAIFKIPANTPVSLQPLDAEGSAVQWMRSWFTGMPGEIVSCIGCHEDQNQIPLPKRVTASTKKPEQLTLKTGNPRPFTFDLEVQPVLDRACVACHNGEDTQPDFRGGIKDPATGFGTAYLHLHPYVKRQGPEADMAVLQPYEYHVSNSELIRMLKKGHYNVKLKEEEWQALYNWIDFNAPDKSTFTAWPLNGFNQIKRRIELNDKYANGAGVDWQKEIETYEQWLKAQGPVTPELPEKAEKSPGKTITLKGWPLGANAIQNLVNKEKEQTKVIHLTPELTINLVRIPAGKFIMGDNEGDPDNRPTAKVNIPRSFWMSEIEITNEQYNALIPGHDSRYVDQLWKDHTTPGYPANLPHQPVTRVSWEEAMEYCARLSERTGLKITLPTEAQWEWACRAGSNQEFWFGNLNTDFGTKENLADRQLVNMAVSGVDPQPMDSTEFWFPYYNYLPRENRFDDGNMILCDSKLYEANPFGLYSMHGNVAEWTRSGYHPYPYKEKNNTATEIKVVRGGSWTDRPKFATAYIRKPFYSWQKVHNVGFRIIIEE